MLAGQEDLNQLDSLLEITGVGRNRRPGDLLCMLKISIFNGKLIRLMSYIPRTAIPAECC